MKHTDIVRLERVQYREAKLVAGAFHFTSQDKLNEELCWETIIKSIEFLSLCLFHKIHLQETRPLVKHGMSKLDLEGNNKTR